MMAAIKMSSASNAINFLKSCFWQKIKNLDNPKQVYVLFSISWPKSDQMEHALAL